MTCCVGFEHDGRVTIGGDSAAIGGLDIDEIEDEKVFSFGDFVFGISGSFRIGQVLRFGCNPPEQRASQDDLEYLVTDWMDNLRETFRDKGCLSTWDTEDDPFKGSEHIDSAFLVGYNGRLYTVSTDLQVLRSRVGYASVGCGAPYALGALYANVDGLPRERLERALEAAARFSAGVRAPFYFVESQ